MLSFHPIHQAGDTHWAAWVDTYLTSFPIEEQRPLSSIERLIVEEKRFKVIALLSHDAFIGLLTYWEFDSFVYIEHFAISPSYRSLGHGARVLTHFVRSHSLPIVLEAEPPTEATAIRRVQFYTRNGFVLYDYDYYQPPYAPDREGLSLCLMGTNPDNPAFSSHVAQTLHHEVYNIRLK